MAEQMKMAELLLKEQWFSYMAIAGRTTWHFYKKDGHVFVECHGAIYDQVTEYGTLEEFAQSLSHKHLGAQIDAKRRFPA